MAAEKYIYGMYAGIFAYGGQMRLSRSIVGKAEAEAVAKVICEDGYLGMGAATKQFEQMLAAYLGVEEWQVISANSGTAALHLAVWCAVARARRQGRILHGTPAILVPTLTFVASFQAIVAGGCLPIACDVHVETGTLDIEDAARKMTPDVIAVMHVDYASNPWRLDRVYEFGAKYGIAVIDDAAHAFGCRRHGRRIGSFGDLVCFSFDGIKNITSGEGGCLVVFNREDAGIAADARLLGVENDTAKRFAGSRSWDPDVSAPGLRYHLSNIMAAIGMVQLERLEKEFVPARRHLYKLYKSLLYKAEDVKLLLTDPEDYIVPHIMPVRIMKGKRDRVVAALAAADIPTGLHYKPNHLLSLFASDASFPGAEELHAELVTLPLHPGLSDEDVRFVCETVTGALV